ncbi:hypothetical protein [Oceanobacillus sp. J11TS1]|uniref:hypothetical protein n=1 Tax=Oceanobacillus sp. J11TS1 TaxID=2807191 RepID=UPI001AFF5EBC|nr:hypothetical protein [Oceanobacillus sp. J11TS1]GIO23668.1 hypothetical protein J11TS1_22490 [Oceanobacillus sp. J11TS1]
MKEDLASFTVKTRTDHEKGVLDGQAMNLFFQDLFMVEKNYVPNLVKSKFSNEISVIATTSLVNWWKQNTTYFVDRGLTDIIIY